MYILAHFEQKVVKTAKNVQKSTVFENKNPSRSTSERPLITESLIYVGKVPIIEINEFSFSSPLLTHKSNKDG